MMELFGGITLGFGIGSLLMYFIMNDQLNTVRRQAFYRSIEKDETTFPCVVQCIEEDAVPNVRYIGLVDDYGMEPIGGNPPYRRLPVTWAPPVDDGVHKVLRPTHDFTFDVPEGFNVYGWCGYDSPQGGTVYSGGRLYPERFKMQGEFVLLAVSTGFSYLAWREAIA
jgi:hypothetical protein